MDLRQARACAIACADAYMPSPAATIVGNDLCTAVITRRGAEVIVAFQGSNSGADWWSNFDFHLACRGGRASSGRVSRGFLESFERVKLDLVMASMPDDDEIITITGHSRGGPHAALLALHYAELGIKPAGLYTFACPRFCDREHAAYSDDALAGIHHRFVYESDLITRLPFSVFGHSHCGELRWFDGRQWRTSMPLITRLGVFLFNRRWPFIGNNVADHSIGAYVNALKPQESQT